jgi:hypothetical protein
MTDPDVKGVLVAVGAREGKGATGGAGIIQGQYTFLGEA